MNIDYFKKTSGYMIDGMWYPRVTSIIQTKSKPALYYFYAKAASYKEAEEKKKKAAAEGTEVHELFEKLVVGKPVKVPPKFIGIKQAFDEFLQQYNFFTKGDWLERRIRHPLHRYAGTFDMLAEINGTLSILDIKTSASVYDDYRLQTAAYVYALNEEPWVLNEKGNKTLLHKDVEKRYILWVNQIRKCQNCSAKLRLRSMGDKAEKGSATCEHKWGNIEAEWELIDFDDPKDKENHIEKDFQGFVHCKGLWEWDNRKILEGIGYL